MSEVKGTLLTIILVLAVFATVYAAISVAINRKAVDVAQKIENAGNPSAQAAEPAAGAAAAAEANALIYHY